MTKTIQLKNKIPKCLSKTRFVEIEKLDYKDNSFEAGLVRNSPHKCNTIYLKQGDLITHLRNDEAIAIIRCLSMALWCSDIFKRNHFPKLKWKKLSVAKGGL